MSDMLETFVRKGIENEIKTNYPHIQHPAGMYAKIVQVKTDNEKYVYTLKILDKTLNVDNDFPEIPNVKSSIRAQKEDIVAVLLLYGGSDVFVLGGVNDDHCRGK